MKKYEGGEGACVGAGDIKYSENGESKKHEVVIIATTDRKIICINAQNRDKFYIPDNGEWTRIEF